MPLTTRVSDSVYCVQRRDYLSCSYFVVRGDNVVLIDAGIDATGRDMIDGLAEVGRRPQDVSAILLTHWHNDHSSGAAVMRELSGARIYFHADGRNRFTREARARGPRGWLAERLPDVGFWAPLRGLLELAPPRAVDATTLVSDGDLIEGEFRVLETPGHERGHLSFYFEPEQVLFAGDALAVAHDRIVFMSRFLTENIEQARRSMLRCLEPSTQAICPGHRYPLIKPRPDEIARARDMVERLRWWPIVGC
ncbi:MAG TPA: MBL fold metallo-hydrolase [Pirellulaceae bacterium]|nr:MBL fold metallo-hydrolase [Pirellulaceae bacterium]